MKTNALTFKKSIFTSLLLVILINCANLYSQIRITKVDPFTDQVTIHNYGTSMVPLSGYWFCTKITYGSLASATLINGSLNLTAGSDVTLVVNTASGLNNISSDLSIYFQQPFGTATNMVDFMQYGDSFPVGLGREGEAVSQGLWTADTFILGDPAPWSYIGNGSQNGDNFWTSSTLSVNDELLNSALSVYPNPVNIELKIKKIQNVNLNEAEIFDITGRHIRTVDLKQNVSEKTISLNGISKGIYFIRITDFEGGIVAKKFIKE